MKQLEQIIKNIIQFRSISITVLILVLCVSVYQTITKLTIDNSLTIWFLDDDPSYKAYVDFQEEFGSDEIFIAMFPVSNALDTTAIKKLSSLHESIDSLFYVKTSFSLAKAKYPIYTNQKLVFDDLYNSKRSEKGLKTLFSKLPNITSQLVSKDYKNLFLYIQLNPTPTIEKKRKEILGELNSKIEVYFDNYHLTGPPVLNDAYSNGIYKESMIFGVLTVLVITIMLLFLLPHRRYLAVSLFAVGAPVTILFGIITSLGYALNMISMLIPTILLVYSVSDVVHVINIYHKEGILNKNIDKVKLLTLSIRKSFTPCFYTTLTTFVGYFALYLSPLPAFKNMGILTCIGLLLSFFLVYSITIIGFSFMSYEFKPSKQIFSTKQFSQTRFIYWINKVTTRYKTSIVLGFSFVLIYGLYSVFLVKIDTNSLDLLSEGKAKTDLRLVERELSGSSRLQLNISKSNSESVLDRDTFILLENFQRQLEKNPLIGDPVSVINIKSFLEKRSKLSSFSNSSPNNIKNTLSTIDQEEKSFFKFFSKDFKSVAITINFKEIRTSQLEKLILDISNDFEETFDTTNYKIDINGFAVVFSQLNNFILQTQFKSFFAAFFVAFLCLWFFIKSIKTTILVLIPNILPLAILAIFMSILDIPLDVTTAMITPIMLGIAMDDTIHLVYKYRKRKSIKETPESRMNNAMLYTGNALFSTTIALVAGFIIISTSAVPSVRDFGLLCAITVAIALITDIFYLPALLKKFDS